MWKNTAGTLWFHLTFHYRIYGQREAMASMARKWLNPLYSLVICYIAMENHHFEWESSLFLWPFSIANRQITRGYPARVTTTMTLRNMRNRSLPLRSMTAGHLDQHFGRSLSHAINAPVRTLDQQNIHPMCSSVLLGCMHCQLEVIRPRLPPQRIFFKSDIFPQNTNLVSGVLEAGLSHVNDFSVYHPAVFPICHGEPIGATNWVSQPHDSFTMIYHFCHPINYI